MKKSHLLRVMSLWPPYLGAGIRVRRISPDFKEVDVEMKLRFWNQNYVGSHFGGSLFAMVDPFYMLMLIENLGKGYVIWDKAATIRFKKPGQGRVRAEFRLSDEQLTSIRHEVDQSGRQDASFQIQILDEKNEIVAEVEKIISVKKKSTHNT